MSAAFHSSNRKSTRLNSSHLVISYAVFCLKKKSMNPQRVRRLLQPDFQLIVPPARQLRRGVGEALHQERLEVALEMQGLERTEQAQLVIVGIASGTEQCHGFAQEHVVH